MLTKDLFACASHIAGNVRAESGVADATLPFGGMNIILFGDFHQFPPVSNPSAALYCQKVGTARAELGRAIYMQFETVVTLRDQMRIQDAEWGRILGRSRLGECTKEDLVEIRKLLVTSPDCDLPDFVNTAWKDAILVTPRHGVRERWNHAKLIQHCERTGNAMFAWAAEDTVSSTGVLLTRTERVIVAGMKETNTANLPELLKVAVGMKAMVTLNIAAESNLANGTRGEVVEIILDPREGVPQVDEETGLTNIRYPPAMILFRPLNGTKRQYENLENGCIPIFPSEGKFPLKHFDGSTATVKRLQYALTGGYAFTDYKSQGQTIEYVIVDLGRPPQGTLTPFSAYVALSRSRGRGTIRLLRDFENELFTRHPSEDLRQEDVRLLRLSTETEDDYNLGKYTY